MTNFKRLVAVMAIVAVAVMVMGAANTNRPVERDVSGASAGAQPQVTNIVHTNLTLNFGATSTLTFSDVVANVGSTLKATDVVTINPPAVAQTNGVFTAWISNTVCYARYHNYSAGTIDPASGSFVIQVFQYK